MKSHVGEINDYESTSVDRRRGNKTGLQIHECTRILENLRRRQKTIWGSANGQFETRQLFIRLFTSDLWGYSCWEI